MADPLRITPVIRLGRDIMQSLVAVSHASSPNELLTSNVAGFLYITNVDSTENTITYLAPCPGKLPGRFLLLGTLKFYLD